MKSTSQDDLDHLPSISLSEDDLSERPTERSAKARPARPAAKKNNDSQPKAPSRFPVGTMVLGVALLALAGGGYLQLQAVQKELQDTRSRLAMTSSQLMDVSGTVSETGETLNRSGNEVKDELKAVNFEIRKLWDLANKRNRPMIESQEKELDSLTKNLAATEKSLSGSVSKISGDIKALEKTAGELDGVKKELRAMNAELVAGSTVNREQLDAMQKTIDNLSVSVKKALDSNKTLSANVSKQMKDYEEKIKAVDAHRQQVNRRLVQIEASIRNLSSPAGTGLGLEPAAKP
ncbi:hypothetical protein [Parendozoicomonas haliclonae]|uniref:Chromosome segregation protein n=1 Tax=Parendozoicomonas haliclonae TaxID=1960125 RepID=A0A1X7AHT1_9GAMM|nr:hypothetical protein [Parendozoicomonas haliclonae]SMA42217.1 chromosome segregation protein [Parendozoicomonas haliclonae]